jgi:hypothetical protein
MDEYDEDDEDDGGYLGGGPNFFAVMSGMLGLVGGGGGGPGGGGKKGSGTGYAGGAEDGHIVQAAAFQASVKLAARDAVLLPILADLVAALPQPQAMQQRSGGSKVTSGTVDRKHRTMSMLSEIIRTPGALACACDFHDPTTANSHSASVPSSLQPSVLASRPRKKRHRFQLVLVLRALAPEAAVVESSTCSTTRARAMLTVRSLPSLLQPLVRRGEWI